MTEDGFEACVCNGTTPGVDGGRDASTDAPVVDASAPGEFLEPCGADRACAAADAVCFDFPMKGPICTKRCTQASDCPAPSGVCTPKQGVCRAP